jgi:hypothetical protein
LHKLIIPKFLFLGKFHLINWTILFFKWVVGEQVCHPIKATVQVATSLVAGINLCSRGQDDTMQSLHECQLINNDAYMITASLV